MRSYFKRKIKAKTWSMGIYIYTYVCISIYIYTAENLKDWDNGKTRILAAAKEWGQLEQITKNL